MKKIVPKEDTKCKYPHKKLWCVTIMAIAIIALAWCAPFGQLWPKIVVTILAALILVRSMMVNCCKPE